MLPPLASFHGTTELIREQFSELSPQFQAAARYLLEHPQDVAVESMRTIAGRAGVQPATMVRFAQSIGFEGWPRLREVFVAQFRAQPERYAVRAQDLIDRIEPQSLITETFRAQKANLDLTEAQNPETLLRAARLLAAARVVHVAGFRACYSIAFTFHYLYRFFRSSVSLLNGDAGTLEMQLRAIASDDAAIIVSFAPYSREAQSVAYAAKEAGCRIIAITDSEVAPIALAADETILFSVGSPSFFPSMVAGIAVIETLLEILVSQGGKAAVSQIESAEQQLHESKAYGAPVKSRSKLRDNKQTR